ncbi:MAG TPA: signal peptidase I [Acidobacteriota bacterium]|jgi:signal peptidase I|nr:signal peptidase I [Acidobacteriota bacterium]
MTTEQVASKLTPMIGEGLVAQFYRDIIGVLIRPKLQLVSIREREEIWESFILLFIPFYVAFNWVGAAYFDHDPFPLYSTLLPAGAAIALILLDVATLHWAARLLRGGGTYRGLLSVYGFANLPKVLLPGIALILFLLFPSALISFGVSNKVLVLAVGIAAAIAMTIWNFVLKVLALRVAYGMGLGKCIGTLFLSLVFFGILFFPSLFLGSGSMHTSLGSLQPYLLQRYHLSEIPEKFHVSIPLDRIAFRLRSPRRFELVSVTRKTDGDQKHARVHAHLGSPAQFRNQELVRIIGIPGDRVEVRTGQAWLDGAALKEEYIVEPNSELNLEAAQVPPGSVFVLSDNRQVDPAKVPTGLISIDSISGRVAVGKYPFGWLFFKPQVFK